MAELRRPCRFSFECSPGNCSGPAYLTAQGLDEEGGIIGGDPVLYRTGMCMKYLSTSEHRLGLVAKESEALTGDQELVSRLRRAGACAL